MECNDRVRGGDLRQRQGQSRQLEVVGSCALRQRGLLSVVGSLEGVGVIEGEALVSEKTVGVGEEVSFSTVAVLLSLMTKEIKQNAHVDSVSLQSVLSLLRRTR